MDNVSNTASKAPTNGGTGDFFAVDRRAWVQVCGLGMNAAIAYLVIARGSGGDNRTSMWSANAIEQRTHISRSRAQAAIAELERAKVIVRDPMSKRDHPRYKIALAHEIPGCEAFPPSPLTTEQKRVLDNFDPGWNLVPDPITPEDRKGSKLWKIPRLREIADELVDLGHLFGGQRKGKVYLYHAFFYDAEAAVKSDWIWLPNSLVDGAADETTPIELILQTSSVLTLRLLIELYGTHRLDEDGGIHFRQIRQEYVRHKVGGQGPYVVWGFVPDQVTIISWREVPFIASHFTAALLTEIPYDMDKERTIGEEFWASWDRLRSLGLIEMVPHLVHADSDEGEIVHPMAFGGTGLEVEREVFHAARQAAVAMITPGQHDRAMKQGVVALAPVLRHIEGVQMLGIARLRYRPKTNRALAFFAQEEKWRAFITRYEEIARGAKGR
jgi:hypothetical protein